MTVSGFANPGSYYGSQYNSQGYNNYGGGYGYGRRHGATLARSKLALAKAQAREGSFPSLATF